MHRGTALNLKLSKCLLYMLYRDTLMHDHGWQDAVGFDWGWPNTSPSRPVHTAPFSYENGAKLIRSGLAFTWLRCEHGAFRKR